jgi:hypothetical protein
MSRKLFTNNANTTLASGISSSATALNVVSGTGALFPNPTGGDNFTFTLVKNGNPTVYEVCLCTARSGDTFSTIVRAQENTPSALSWNAGDTVTLLPTAAGLDDFLQAEDLPVVLSAYKPATTTRSSNVFAADPDLVIAIPGAGTYEIGLGLYYYQAAGFGTNAGISFSLNASVLGNLAYSIVNGIYYYSGNTAGIAAQLAGPITSDLLVQATLDVANNADWYNGRGTITTTGALNLTINWAQTFTNAGAATSLLRGSYIKASQIV